MCPACLTTIALIAAGAGSTGGITALVVHKLRGRNVPQQSETLPAAPEHDRQDAQSAEGDSQR